MADQDLPELQPTGSGRGKQIVFLFMSAVVVAVVIFLLGVSVGRGVRPSNVAAAASSGDAPSDGTSVTPAPAAPGDLNYHDSLRGAAPSDPSKSNAASSPVAPAPAAGPSPSTAPPPPVNEAPPVASPESARTPAPKASAGATKPASGKYSIQVGAFTTPAAAQAMVARVRAKDKSYPVATVTLPEGAVKTRYSVRVGPYATADEANRIMSRLKKDGFTAILKR